jgi:glycosyltransferase involved in cell wall biosynthesis
MPVPLILVSNAVIPFARYHREVANDISPRIDYLEIAEKIGGQILGYENHSGSWYGPIRLFESRIKIDFIEAIETAKKFSNFSLYLSASEKSAIPLSFLMAALREDAPHILIGHHLSSIPKTRLYRYWKFREYIDHVICVSQAQADFAKKKLEFPESRVDFLYDKVDHLFFRPIDNHIENYILAVGQEQRDYKTLIDAIEGTGIELVIVASSPWSKFNLEIAKKPNVNLVSNIPYTEIRDLYRGAKIIVVPLFENNYGAGLNTMLESMAMAKTLVVTKTCGIDNYVLHDETGLYAAPGNTGQLRDQLLMLWDADEKRKRLGSNARQAIIDKMNIDIYVERIVEIVESYLRG